MQIKRLWVINLIILCLLGMLSGGCKPYGRYKPKEVEDHYPITIKTYDGYAGRGRTVEQTFQRSPRTILATCETTIDNLIFLGLEDRIIAVYQVAEGKNHYPYEEQYKSLFKLPHGRLYPSKEAVLNLNPEIIVGWGSLFGDSAIESVKEWHARGIHTYVMSNTMPGNGRVRCVANCLEDLHNLARIFDVEATAEPKIKKLEEKLRHIEAEYANLSVEKRPTVATVQGIYGNEYFGRNSVELTADIIRLAGGRCLDPRTGGRVSIERLIQLDPDVIMIIDNGNTAPKKIKALTSNPVLQKLRAVKEGRFFIIGTSFYCGSFRTIEDIERLHKLLYEEMR